MLPQPYEDLAFLVNIINAQCSLEQFPFLPGGPTALTFIFGMPPMQLRRPMLFPLNSITSYCTFFMGL